MKVSIPASLQKLRALYLLHVHDFNFTAHREEERFDLYNLEDSYLPLTLDILHFPQGAKICDIGTGGGFPGLILAALRPDIYMTLIDSVEKKLRLIEMLANKAGITNITTVHERLEDVARTSLRESFDVVVSKAVAKWPTLLELALPLLKQHGMFYAYQGKHILEEIDESVKVVRLLGGGRASVTPYTLSNAEERYIVAIPKMISSPEIYPRKAPLPKTSPLFIAKDV